VRWRLGGPDPKRDTSATRPPRRHLSDPATAATAQRPADRGDASL